MIFVLSVNEKKTINEPVVMGNKKDVKKSLLVNDEKIQVVRPLSLEKYLKMES